MISLEDWALIRHLHRSEGLSQRAIARQLGIARDTVAAAVASDGPPKYERTSVPSAIDAVEPRIRALLSTYPQLQATVLAERVGWTGSISWFRERVRAIRPEYLPADPVDRLEHPPGRVIQCDLWFPAPKIPVGFGQEAMLPVLVMVAAFSRFIAAVMLPSRQTMDLVAGMWQLLAGSFAAVPHELWWDNEAGIGRRGRLTDPVTALMGTLGSRLVQLKPYDPESKGMVERANRYLETSFLPGRTFSSPADFNHQLQQWLPTANRRRVRALDGLPIDFLDADRAQMLTLPPVAPVVQTVTSVRLGRDYYVRVAGNDYSVDPSAIGQLVEVSTTLAQVTVSRAGHLLAAHDRCWAARQTLTDPVHVAAAAALRQQFQAGPPPAGGDHLVRDLADYDRAFGVDFTTAITSSDGEVA
ncbi:IS21 family transposase [Mycobacterium avium]|uniref:IS21 family transposase n=1 Tax=Mycobacterium avium TaxID=1764 RepID=UPI001CDC2E93|nr:IS21 family transposase [Mycobacterium avium]MCA4730200.1 IS21 family transposase [Mycobacterium avium subsp. hominissuis]MDO2361271.1 IS21 family transposase [Mycobacterium avium subsp. hominissuis]UBV07219.1 IS21 family transposase [Mycobacterium avium subsp. hominissuis]